MYEHCPLTRRCTSRPDTESAAFFIHTKVPCVRYKDRWTRVRALGRTEGLDFRVRGKGWSSRDGKVVGGKAMWSEK